MDDKFTIKYSVADGYVGKDRPHSFTFPANYLNGDETDDQLVSLYEQSVNDHFEQNIFPEGSNCEEFVRWARERLDAAKDS